MDGDLLILTLFLIATFAAAVVAGVAGFAFGLIAAAVWLHILSPLQTASLIIAFGLVVQGVSVWKLRRAIDWRRLWPFMLGGAIGVPLGVALLGWARPDSVRTGVGAILVLYSLYALTQPATKPITTGGRLADSGVGFLNGVLGGFSGLAGILVTVWCGMRSWPKDQQRAVFQPAAVAVFLMSAAWLGAAGAASWETVKLFLTGLPALIAGTWLGLRLYKGLDESRFRKLVLILLLASGIALIF